MAEMLLWTKAVTKAPTVMYHPAFLSSSLEGHSAKAKQFRGPSLIVTLSSRGWQSRALPHPCHSTRGMEPWKGVTLWIRLS